MADADLGPGLAGTAAGPAGGLTATVVERDRRWVRRVTWLAASFWVLTLGTVIWMQWAIDYAVLPKIHVLMRDTPGASHMPENPKVRPEASREEKTVGVLVTYLYVLTYGLVILTAVVGVAAVASVSTLVLVHLTRRATLRQINLSLQAISEQLRQMQAARPPAGPGG